MLLRSDARNEILLASMLLMAPAGGILLHASGILPLGTALAVVAPPAILASAILFYHQARSRAARVAVNGLLAGFFATLAYDGVRLLLMWLGLVAHPFRSIEQYGLLIVGTGDPWWATSAGWGFNFWNGATFGMFFALAFGRPTILKGVLWGFFLETVQVITYPKLFVSTIQGELLASSAIGHLAYGLTLATTLRLRQTGGAGKEHMVEQLLTAIGKPIAGILNRVPFPDRLRSAARSLSTKARTANARAPLVLALLIGYLVAILVLFIARQLLYYFWPVFGGLTGHNVAVLSYYNLLAHLIAYVLAAKFVYEMRPMAAPEKAR